MKSVVALVTAIALVAATPLPAHAYLKFGVRLPSGVVDIKWSHPVPYFVTERAVPGVSADAFRAAIGRAFATWEAVPTAVVRSQFQGVTTTSPGLQDGRSTLGFLDRPDLDRVLGATSFLLDSTTGEILEADIFFNTRFDWSTAAAGELGRIDLESVAVHEIGHLLGLGHSAIGETEIAAGGGRRVIGSGAVMFPIALSAGSIAERQLLPDDVAGISDLYPGTGADAFSSISGRVTRNGAGVFGAHVVAISLETGVLVGGFVLSSSGDYVVAGLAPGPYLIRAEPLDDADPESFFSGAIDVDYRATYSPRVIIAPRRGGSTQADIEVRPK